jgi:hypothetical protein
MKFEKVTPQVNFPRLEEEVLGLWEKTDAFGKSVESRPEGQAFRVLRGATDGRTGAPASTTRWQGLSRI